MTEISTLSNKNLDNMDLNDIVKTMAVNINSMAKAAESNTQAIQMNTQVIQSVVQREAIRDQEMANLRNEFRDIKDNQRIEAFEDKIIKDKIKTKVKRILGDSYKSSSKRRIAYSWAYSKIHGFGYVAGGGTKIRHYKALLQCLEDGIIDFTKEDVNRRYKRIQEEKEEEKQD